MCIGHLPVRQEVGLNVSLMKRTLLSTLIRNLVLRRECPALPVLKTRKPDAGRANIRETLEIHTAVREPALETNSGYKKIYGLRWFIRLLIEQTSRSGHGFSQSQLSQHAQPI